MKPVKSFRHSVLFPASSRQKILDVLCDFPEKEFSLSDLAKESRVAKPHMNEVLRDLESRELIKIVKLSKIWRISANISNERFREYKLTTNLLKLYGSELVNFLNWKFENPKAIILFGSYRKGEDISSSDIDIAVETEDDYHTVSPEGISVFEAKLKRKIQIHLFNRNSIDINVFSNIANGIVLSGFLEVKD